MYAQVKLPFGKGGGPVEPLQVKIYAANKSQVAPAAGGLRPARWTICTISLPSADKIRAGTNWFR
jgi:hypothetical protein